MSAGRIALLVTGCIAALISLALLAGGGVLVWAHTTQRNDDGYYTTRHETFLTEGYALRSDDLDLGTEGPDWLFVARYLEGVEHDIVADVEVDPFEAEYQHESGDRRPAPPETQPFWAARGVDGVEWDVDEGRWMAVVMNADASNGIVAQVSVGAKSDLILWTIFVLLGLGLPAHVYRERPRTLVGEDAREQIGVSLKLEKCGIREHAGCEADIRVAERGGMARNAVHLVPRRAPRHPHEGVGIVHR